MSDSHANFDDDAIDPRAAVTAAQFEMESRSARRAMNSTAGLGPLILALLALWVVVLVRVLVVPSLTKVFADFDTALPALTELLIRTPSWVFVAFALSATGGLVALQVNVRDTRVRMIVMFLAFFAFAGVVGLTVVALFLPLTKLIQSVS